MKIADVRIHKLIVPMKPGAVHSEGVDDDLCAADPISGRNLPFWEFPKWIVEVVGDDGVTGVGEPRRGDLDAALRAYAERVVGRELIELPLGGPLPRRHDEPYLVHEAFEMAWYDLLGKRLGVPVWHLLGGRRIERVPIDYWMGRCTPEDTARRAARAADLGFRGVKMKCALGDPVVERVRAVRETAPHFSIVLDPNERFETVEETCRLAEAIGPYCPVTFESPVPQHRLDWYVELRRRLDQPVALHLATQREFIAALRAEAADCYNFIGPVADFVGWARLAQDAGFPVWRGTGMDLGVRDASALHAAASAGCALPSDIIGHVLREDDLIVRPIGFDDGGLLVPEAPGLGVEIDREALERYTVA